MTNQSNSPINSFDITLASGGLLPVREYKGGVYSFGVAQRDPLKKAHLNGYKEIKGFFNAVKQLVTNGNGKYVRGFHQHISDEALADVWESTKGRDGGEVAYVNFRELRDETVAEMLKAQGITKQDNYYLALYADKNGLHPWYKVQPETEVEFRARIAKLDDNAGREPSDLEWEDYKKAWNQQNKHSGMDLALRALAGNFAVIVAYSPTKKTKAEDADRNREWLTEAFSELSLESEKIRSLKNIRNADREAAAATKRHIYSMQNNENFELSAEAEAAQVEGAKVKILNASGKKVTVKVASLIGETIEYVHENGLRARPGTTPIKDEIWLTVVLDKAAKSGLTIRLVA